MQIDGKVASSFSKSDVLQYEFLGDLGATLPSLDYWFYGCQALASVSGWENVSRLASVRYAFDACTGLVGLDLGGLDPSGDPFPADAEVIVEYHVGRNESEAADPPGEQDGDKAAAGGGGAADESETP